MLALLVVALFQSVPETPLADPAGDLALVVADVKDGKWLALAVLVVTYLVRLTARDSRFPITVPARWQPLAAMVLGQVLAVLMMVVGGMAWWKAALQGLVVGGGAIALYDVAVKAAYGSDQPPWMRRLALACPKKSAPPVDPPPPEERTTP